MSKFVDASVPLSDAVMAEAISLCILFSSVPVGHRGCAEQQAGAVLWHRETEPEPFLEVQHFEVLSCFI